MSQTPYKPPHPPAPNPPPPPPEIDSTGPGGWIIAALIALLGLALYLLTLSPAAFPGLPGDLLARHCRLDPANPPLLDPLWGRIIRSLVTWNPASPARPPNLFSAICGAIAAALFSALIARLRYFLPDQPPPALIRRERTARLLAAASAGAYLLFSVPFWIASTRSLPATFHLCLILSVIWLFSEHQRTGRNRFLLAAGFLAGLASIETTTLILLFPFFPLLLARDRFHDSHVPFLLPTLALLLPFLLGAAISYAITIKYLLFTGAAALANIYGPWNLLFHLLLQQKNLVTQIQFTIALPILFSITAIPWLFLFLFSSRTSSTYNFLSALARVAFLVVLILVLFNTFISPFNCLGMSLFLVAPYPIMAACAAYLIGELFLLGQPLPSDSARARCARRLSTTIACLAIAAIPASAFSNFPIARGSDSSLVDAAVSTILDARDPLHDVILSSGVIDNQLRIALHARRESALIITLPRVDSPAYLRTLVPFFQKTSPSSTPLGDDFGAFLFPFLLDSNSVTRVASLDFEHVIRPYGFPAPHGLLTFLLPSAATRDQQLDSLFLLNRAFWQKLEPISRTIPHPKNPAHPYFHYLIRQSAKRINDFALILAQASPTHLPQAREALLAAQRLDPDNPSPPANLLLLANAYPDFLPQTQTAALSNTLHDIEHHTPPDALFNTAISSGYLLSPSLPDGQTRLWMYSGIPFVRENDQHIPPDPATAANDARVRRLIAYAHYNANPFLPLNDLHAKLARDESRLPALHALAQNAIDAHDFSTAEIYLDQAAIHGSPPLELALDRAILDYARGNETTAISSLSALSHQAYSDLRLWLALAAIIPGNSPLYNEALTVISARRGKNPKLYLATANLHLARNELDAARHDLNAALALSPRNPALWELLLDVDERQNTPDLRNEHLAALLKFEPQHPYRFNAIALAAYAASNFPLAHQAFSRALTFSRTPATLTQMANLQFTRTDAPNLKDALAYLDEALRLASDYTEGRLLRARIYARLGRLSDALLDLNTFLDLRPDEPSARLLRARLLLKIGRLSDAAAELPYLYENRVRLPRSEVRLLRLLRHALHHLVPHLVPSLYAPRFTLSPTPSPTPPLTPTLTPSLTPPPTSPSPHPTPRHTP